MTIDIRHIASAKVYYEEFGGAHELSIKHGDNSPIEFMKWLINAIEYYGNKLKYDNEYGYVRCFVIDYRIGDTKQTVIIDRKGAEESSGQTY